MAQYGGGFSAYPQYGNNYGTNPVGSYSMQNNTPIMPASMTQPQPIKGLIRVTGIEGARAYQMPPDSVMPLFDADTDVMYVKTTDGAGFPTIRSFRFTPIEDAPQPEAVDYVTRKEFEELQEQIKELVNAKQPVSDTKQ